MAGDQPEAETGRLQSGSACTERVQTGSTCLRSLGVQTGSTTQASLGVQTGSTATSQGALQTSSGSGSSEQGCGCLPTHEGERPSSRRRLRVRTGSSSTRRRSLAVPPGSTSSEQGCDCLPTHGAPSTTQGSTSSYTRLVSRGVELHRLDSSADEGDYEAVVRLAEKNFAFQNTVRQGELVVDSGVGWQERVSTTTRATTGHRYTTEGGLETAGHLAVQRPGWFRPGYETNQVVQTHGWLPKGSNWVPG